MKISRKNFDCLVESLVEQALNKRFASSDPFKKTAADENVAKLDKYLRDPNLFFHFSETGKIGINPQSTDHPGVRGFYGFKMTPEMFFKESHHEWFTRRKYIVVFRLKSNQQILELEHRKHLEFVLNQIRAEFYGEQPLKRHEYSKAEQTRLLQKVGFDGVYSGEQFFMTDIKNELAVFPPYQDKIEVVEILPNPLFTLKQNRDGFDPKYDEPDEGPEVRVPSKYKDNRSAKGKAKSKLPKNQEPKSKSEAEKRRKRFENDNERVGPLFN